VNAGDLVDTDATLTTTSGGGIGVRKNDDVGDDADLVSGSMFWFQKYILKNYIKLFLLFSGNHYVFIY